MREKAVSLLGVYSRGRKKSDVAVVIEGKLELRFFFLFFSRRLSEKNVAGNVLSLIHRFVSGDVA